MTVLGVVEAEERLAPAKNVLAFMLYETLRHPDLRKRMTAEADAFFTAPGEPTAGRLQALDVTHRVARRRCACTRSLPC